MHPSLQQQPSQQLLPLLLPSHLHLGPMGGYTQVQAMRTWSWLVALHQLLVHQLEAGSRPSTLGRRQRQHHSHHSNRERVRGLSMEPTSSQGWRAMPRPMV
jgi:hypothetical protein